MVQTKPPSQGSIHHPLLLFLAEQRAVRLQQIPQVIRLLEEREAPASALHQRKSKSYTLLERLAHAGLLTIEHVGKDRWVWLTKAGLHCIDPEMPWKRPASRDFALLHAITTVRLALAERYPEATWYPLPRQVPPLLAPWPIAHLHDEGKVREVFVLLHLPETDVQMDVGLAQHLLAEPTHELWYYAPPPVATRLRAARTRLEREMGTHFTSTLWIFSYPLLPTIAWLREHHAPVRDLCWSPDGQQIASGDLLGRLLVWETPTAVLRYATQLSSAALTAVAWSPDGRFLAMADTEGRLAICQADTGRYQVAYRFLNPIRALSWSPDRHWIAVCDRHVVRVVRAQRQAYRWHRPLDHGHTIRWSPDGSRLAVGKANQVVLLSAHTGGCLSAFSAHHATPRALSWSPDRHWIASGTNGELLIWDALCGAIRHRLPLPVVDQLRALIWSPEGTSLASAHATTGIILWKVDTGAEQQRFKEHAGIASCLAWSPDGRALALGSSDHSILVYESGYALLKERDQYTLPIRGPPDHPPLARECLLTKKRPMKNTQNRRKEHPCD